MVWRRFWEVIVGDCRGGLLGQVVERAEAGHVPIVVVLGEEPGQRVLALGLLLQGLDQLIIFHDVFQVDFDEVVLLCN